VYRLLKTHDLITGPAFILVKQPMSSTPASNHWHSVFTYQKVIGG
jgi:hypothetical protein